MKTSRAALLALLLVAPLGAVAGQVECYRNGVEVTPPANSRWIVVPRGYNTAPCHKLYNKKGKGCWPGHKPKPIPCDVNPYQDKCPPIPPATPCELNPYGEGCPLACDGETPGGKCRRQREEFTGPTLSLGG